MGLRKLVLLLIITTILSTIACAGDSDNENPHFGAQPAESTVTAPTEDTYTPEVRVIVSTDFGQVVLLDEMVELTSSLSALEILKKVAIVETKYGGGFVHDINDTRSSSSRGDKDWFVYFNGIQSNTGAGDYSLTPGDIEQWDFHDWSFRQFTPAIIGGFPEPFTHGYDGDIRPTIVACDKGFELEVDEIAIVLRGLGIKNVIAKSMDELMKDEKKSSNLILLGSYETELISELNKVWDRMGFFTRFERGKLLVLDSGGKLASEYGPGTGLIQATQNPWNSKGTGACENVVWMITGTDENGVRLAGDTLINQYEEFKYAFAVVVNENGISRIPGLN